MKQVAAMPAEKQVEAVAKKLQELNPGILNPGFDGKVDPVIENEVVTSVSFQTDNDVTDISPVRALAGLKGLICNGTREGWGSGRGKLSDLSPLQGMKLNHLDFGDTRVADLSPLKGMPLTVLNCENTKVSDLSPIAGMRLTFLSFDALQISDLSVLKGMPLVQLSFQFTPVTELSPLRGMKLQHLAITGSRVIDLSPLAGMPLYDLGAGQTEVSDLSPLKDMKLTYLVCDFKPERDTEIIRSIKTLVQINGKPAAEFWKEVEGQQTDKKP